MTNCPNCGAPAAGRRCEYCGTPLEELTQLMGGEETLLEELTQLQQGMGGADGITGRATWDRLHGFTLYADNRPVITITESGLTIERR